MYVSLNELRHRVTILRPTTTVDDAGNIIETGQASAYRAHHAPALALAHPCASEEVATVWAKILPYAAKISDGYAEKVDEVNYHIVIRYRDDVEVTDIIRWRSKKFMQTAPAYDLISNRKYLVLEVRELVEDGNETL